VNRKKRGSTFVTITLEKHTRFLQFLHCCKQEESFTHTCKICPPQLNNVPTLPCESETIIFDTHNAVLEYEKNVAAHL